MYRYASSTKDRAFRSENPINADQFLRHAPSVLATEAHESRSDKYLFIPTIDILRGMWREGFAPYEVRQTLTRDVGKRAFTRHMVRLRHRSAVSSQEEVPEIILINSHDGASSFHLMAGFFRFVCSNGLIAGDVSTDVRIRHSGDVLGSVIEGSYEVLRATQEIGKRRDEYKQIVLSEREQLLLADEAIKLRWDDKKAPITPNRVIRPNRHQDEKPTLWNTFNTIQENLLRGGQSGRSSTGRRLTTRPVTGVSENVKLNRALWSLTDRMAELKGVAA
jgi:hypothetical protein